MTVKDPRKIFKDLESVLRMKKWTIWFYCLILIGLIYVINKTLLFYFAISLCPIIVAWGLFSFSYKLLKQGNYILAFLYPLALVIFAIVVILFIGGVLPPIGVFEGFIVTMVILAILILSLILTYFFLIGILIKKKGKVLK